MNIFASLRSYAGKWNLAASRNFSEEELAEIVSAHVVPSEYGNSVCFVMKTGDQKYIPLSNTSQLAVGQEVNMTTAKLLTLTKPGENPIYRVDA